LVTTTAVSWPVLISNVADVSTPVSVIVYVPGSSGRFRIPSDPTLPWKTTLPELLKIVKVASPN